MTDEDALLSRIVEAERDCQRQGLTAAAILLQDARLAIIRAPKYLTGCLRDGVCRGVCQTDHCQNRGMVVAARVCVEPKQDGVFYTKETS